MSAYAVGYVTQVIVFYLSQCIVILLCLSISLKIYVARKNNTLTNENTYLSYKFNEHIKQTCMHTRDTFLYLYFMFGEIYLNIELHI